MPEGTKVDRCFRKLKSEKGAGHAAAICQSATQQNLHTGEALSEGMARLRKYCGGAGGKPGPCPEGSPSFIPHEKQTPHETTIHVDPRKLPDPFETTRTQPTPGKKENFERFLKTGKPVQAARAALGDAGDLDISDGRHRLAVLKGRGTPSVALTVPKHQAGEFQKRYGHAQHAEKFAESATLPDQEIFTTGVHRGKEYSHRDLDDMVENFKRFSSGRNPLVKIPAVIGHEESQEYLERSDLPAAGWHQTLRNVKERCPSCHGLGKMSGDEGPVKCPRCVGTGIASSLKARFSDVPSKVARLLKRKAYATVSAEVYDNPPEGVPGRGKMLRRTAFLGGELPQIKSLEEINDLYEHSEELPSGPPTRLNFTRVTENAALGTWTCFAEVKPMDREEIIAKLEEMGFSREVLDAADDKMLAEILRVYDTGSNDAGDEEPPPDTAGAAGEQDPEAAAQDPKAAGQPGEQDMEEQEHRLLGGLGEPGREGITPAGKLDQGVQDEIHLGEGDAETANAGTTLPEPKDDAERQQFAAYAQRMFGRAKKMMEKYCSRRMGEAAWDTGGAPAGGGKTAMRGQGSGGSGKTPMNGPDQAGADPHVPEDMGYNLPAAGGRTPKKVSMSATYSEQRIQALVDARVEKAINRVLEKSVGKSIARFEKFQEETEANKRAEAIDSILERYSDRVPPRMRKHYELLLRKADTRTVVEKFKENGKTRDLTEFDQIVRDLAQLPSKFAERFREPTGVAAAAGDTKQWAESTYDRNAEAFKKMGGMKKSEFLELAKKAEDDGTLQKFREQWDRQQSAA